MGWFNFRSEAKATMAVQSAQRTINGQRRLSSTGVDGIHVAAIPLVTFPEKLTNKKFVPPVLGLPALPGSSDYAKACAEAGPVIADPYAGLIVAARTVQVENIWNDVAYDAIRDLLAGCGEIRDIRIVCGTPGHGNMKRARVAFVTNEGARRALLLNHTQQLGGVISVTRALEKPEPITAWDFTIPLSEWKYWTVDGQRKPGAPPLLEGQGPGFAPKDPEKLAEALTMLPVAMHRV